MQNTTLIDRAIIRVSALDEDENARDFLQGLVTQDMNKVLVNAPQWSALLSPQGKCLFDFILWADNDNDDILIDCEHNARDALIKKLMLYRLRRKINIKYVENICIHWALNADDKPYDPRHKALGHRWLITIDIDSENHEKHGGVDEKFRTHRLSYGIVEGLNELGSDKILWLECNAIELNGVSFEKGCYIGQENTARMNYRNKVKRRIISVPIAQANLKRQIFAYDDISIEHRRTDDLADIILPQWLSDKLQSDKANGAK